jgi:anaerobic selenocysteine-containing dehydrogenase
MRGQAALQGLYNPDRLWMPQLKTNDGWQEIPFDKAEALIRGKARAAANRGTERIAMVTETVGQTQLDLFATVLQHFAAAPPVVFEPLAYEPSNLLTGSFSAAPACRPFTWTGPTY